MGGVGRKPSVLHGHLEAAGEHVDNLAHTRRRLRLREIKWYAIKYYSPEATMSAITATEARKNLFGLIQQVNDDHTVVEVVSRHGNAVIVSKDDYDAMTETAYLLRNPANAERLLAAIDRARRGEFEQHDLLDA